MGSWDIELLKSKGDIRQPILGDAVRCTCERRIQYRVTQKQFNYPGQPRHWETCPGSRSFPVVPGHWGLSPVPTGVCQWNQVTRKIILHVPQRVRQARAHGVREGAEEAVRQVRQRLAALSTDVESRKAGLTHRQWEWISS